MPDRLHGRRFSRACTRLMSAASSPQTVSAPRFFISQGSSAGRFCGVWQGRCWLRFGFRFSKNSARYPCLAGTVTNHSGGCMAINFGRRWHGNNDSLRFRLVERLRVYLFGTTVLFASFGMGEAVYRLLFSEFDGATDRIPIEALFGLVFACLATKFGG